MLSEEMYVLKWRDRNNQLETHFLFGQIPSARRLKSRHCFLSSVQTANFPAKVIRCSEWRKRLRNKSHIDIINFHEYLAKGYERYEPYGYVSTVCATVYRPTCSKAKRKKRKVYTGDTTCACGKEEETTAHMVQCSQLVHPCSLYDLIMLNNVRKQCTELWTRMV